MHFFYFDESGDTGGDLNPPGQPILVLGGINLSDERWNTTQEEFKRIIKDWFNGNIPDGFELHAHDLLARQGEGYFAGFSLEQRSLLARNVLNLLPLRKHGVHFIAIEKCKVADTPCNLSLPYDPLQPYLLAFDYLITYINWFVKGKRGRSARGMIILDRKEQFHEDIEKITYCRRFEGTICHRIKRICEFSYPIDSKKNPMIQLSDLIVYCIKRFLEIEHGYHDNWTNDAKKFYAECYSIIHDKIERKSMVQRKGRGMGQLNSYLKTVTVRPRQSWRRHYTIECERTNSQIP